MPRPCQALEGRWRRVSRLGRRGERGEAASGDALPEASDGLVERIDVLVRSRHRDALRVVDEERFGADARVAVAGTVGSTLALGAAMQVAAMAA